MSLGLPNKREGSSTITYIDLSLWNAIMYCIRMHFMSMHRCALYTYCKYCWKGIVSCTAPLAASYICNKVTLWQHRCNLNRKTHDQSTGFPKANRQICECLLARNDGRHNPCNCSDFIHPQPLCWTASVAADSITLTRNTIVVPCTSQCLRWCPLVGGGVTQCPTTVQSVEKCTFY